MKSKIFFASAILSGVVFYACGSFDYGKEKPTEIQVVADEPKPELAWEQDVSLIMQYKCATCHGPFHHKFAPEKAYTAPNNYNFENKETFTKMSSLIKTVLFDEDFRTKNPSLAMPPNYGTPLTDLEKTAIKNYIEKKLPAVSTPPTTGGGTTTPPVATTLKFADVKASLDASCGTCHGANGTYKGIYDLSTQAGAAAKFSIAASRMQSATSPMPSSGRIDSTPDGKKLLEWFKAGAP